MGTSQLGWRELGNEVMVGAKVGGSRTKVSSQRRGVLVAVALEILRHSSTFGL